MFTIFGIVFDTACKSDCVDFRETMKIVVDKLFDSAIQFWPTYWLSSRLRVTCSDYCVIDAGRLEYLAVNLKRIKLLEKLRVISMFTFVGTTHRETYIIRNGKVVNQNQWVYDQARAVIPADRIHVPFSAREGLKGIPRDHRILETLTTPTYWRSASDFKRLEDQDTVFLPVD